MIAVDSLVNLTGKAVYAAGDWSRSIQTGRLRNYLMFLARWPGGSVRRSLSLDSKLDWERMSRPGELHPASGHPVPSEL